MGDISQEESVLKCIIAVAQKKHVRLNPDKKVVDNVVKGIVRNLAKHGSAYCPCRIVTGNEEIDRFNVCPCSNMESEVKTNGQCKCRLYFKEDE